MADRVADIALHGMGAASAEWRVEGDARWLVSTEAGPLDAFLRAATALVNEKGYRGASVDMISARLHVTKGSFYHHNDNKLDLIEACFDRTFKVLRQALEAAESGDGSGWSRACTAVLSLVRFQLSANGPLLRLSSTSALPGQADRQRVHKTLQQLSERMASVLVDGLLDGSIRPLDTSIAAQAVIGLINGAAELHRWVPGVTEASVGALYARPIFFGLLSNDAAPSQAWTP
jgi:AcrR family transcriptional regulator